MLVSTVTQTLTLNQTGVVSDAAGEDSTAVTATYVTDAAINFSTCGANINVCTAAHPNYYSNTIFGHLGYHWNDVDWQPFLGLLGKSRYRNKEYRT